MKTRAEYNILDFLKDDSFLRSVLLLTDDDVEFWDNYVLENPEKKQEIEAAKQLLLSMTFDDETYSEQEKLELLEHVNDQVKSIRRHRLYVGFYKIFAAACVVALLSVGVYSFFAPFTSDLILRKIPDWSLLGKGRFLLKRGTMCCMEVARRLFRQ